jgi:hypothetical protein
VIFTLKAKEIKNPTATLKNMSLHSLFFFCKREHVLAFGFPQTLRLNARRDWAKTWDVPRTVFAAA